MTSTEQASANDDGSRIFSIIRGGKASDQAAETDSNALGSDATIDSELIKASDPDQNTGSTSNKTSDPKNAQVEARDPGSQDADPEQVAVVDVQADVSAEASDAAGAETVADDQDGVDAIIAHATALLDDADPVAYYRSVRSLVREGHSQVLGALEYAPDLEFHSPSTVYVDPAGSTVDTAMLYAHAAYPDFEKVLLPVFKDPARADLLVSIHHLLFVEKRNIALVTNHGQIIDIALVMAALFAAMADEDQTFGVLGEKVSAKEMAEHSNTLVSRMVATRQAFGIPAVQVLQSITRVFLTMPQTASRRRAKLDPTLVRANNTLMRFELERRLAEGGQILAMAASGTQDLSIPQLMHRARAAWRTRRGDDPGEQPTLHLQPLYNGTISLMRACDYVLPVAVSLESKTPSMVVGSLTRLNEDEDCHRVMDWIALTHQEATGVPTIYHRPGDDLFTHVKALISR